MGITTLLLTCDCVTDTNEPMSHAVCVSHPVCVCVCVCVFRLVLTAGRMSSTQRRTVRTTSCQTECVIAMAATWDTVSPWSPATEVHTHTSSVTGLFGCFQMISERRWLWFSIFQNVFGYLRHILVFDRLGTWPTYIIVVIVNTRQIYMSCNIFPRTSYYSFLPFLSTREILF